MQKKFQEGRQAEMANTERERQRANDTETKLNNTEAQLNDARTYIKELEEKLRAQSRQNRQSENK